MDLFEEKYPKFLNEFDEGRHMVLSSSYNDKVSSRMMSIVLINDKLYFQTDKNFRKYNQIIKNPNVSLCIDNIQIDGLCHEIGRPSENKKFVEVFKKYFKQAYTRYSHLDSERLFEIEPVFIQKFTYQNGIPYIEEFKVLEREYKIRKYL